MSINKLRGQFLREDSKPKKPVKAGNDVTVHYLSDVSDFGGYKHNGKVFPKKGAI